jgi:hypothetical protein
MLLYKHKLAKRANKMATRSAIGYKTPEGKVRAVYCHWDGYVAGVGHTLETEYQEARKIAQLVELGDISILDKNIGTKIDFDDREAQRTAEQCLFYGRDRGEANTETKEFDTVGDFVDYYEGAGCEYFYLRSNADWIYHDRYQVGKDALGLPIFDFLAPKVAAEVERLKKMGYDI